MTWLIRADARSLPLVAGCAQCVVTSPPYWGLRDYGVVGQLGLEATPDEYVASLVAIFAGVRDVLKTDGIVWLNLGDTYAPNWSSVRASGRAGFDRNDRQRLKRIEVEPKNLIGIPWRVAFALQADGWYLRADVIWSKPNPMPESVTDRPTKAHEYIFLLAKSPRYYYDADAIREAHKPESLARYEYGLHAIAPTDGYVSAGARNPRAMMQCERLADNVNPLGRNKRSVWHVATQAYNGAHFATFPEALIEPCVLAGSRPGDLVLDPFIGSGTTGVVCERLARRWVGIDLSYHALASERTAQRGLRFFA